MDNATDVCYNASKNGPDGLMRWEDTAMWSEEKAWEWHRARPWMRGCCYIGADCVNRIEQWQSLGFEERWEATDRKSVV